MKKDSNSYRVIEEYRNNWTNEPAWDGTVTMDEIKRLAVEWETDVETLMKQVEEI